MKVFGQKHVLSRKRISVNEQGETGFSIREYGNVHLCALKRREAKTCLFPAGQAGWFEMDLVHYVLLLFRVSCCCRLFTARYMWLNVHYCSHFCSSQRAQTRYHSWNWTSLSSSFGGLLYTLLKNKKKPQHRAAVSQIFWFEMFFHRQLFSAGRYSEWQTHGENGADVGLWADNKSCIMYWYISLKLTFVSQRLCKQPRI